VEFGKKRYFHVSPFLFNIYFDSIIVALKQADNACHMGGVYIGCLAYADDLILISASVVKLQKMLDICSTYTVQTLT